MRQLRIRRLMSEKKCFNQLWYNFLWFNIALFMLFLIFYYFLDCFIAKNTTLTIFIQHQIESLLKNKIEFSYQCFLCSVILQETTDLEFCQHLMVQSLIMSIHIMIENNTFYVRKTAAAVNGLSKLKRHILYYIKNHSNINLLYSAVLKNRILRVVNYWH